MVFSRSRATLGIVFMFAVAPIAAGCGGGAGGDGTAEGGSTGSGSGGSKASGGRGGSISGGSSGSNGGASGGAQAGSPGGGGSGASGGTSGGSSGGTSGGATGGTPGGSTGGTSGGTDAGTPDTSTPPAGGGPCEYKDDRQFCECLAKTCGGDTLADKAMMNHPVYCGTCASPMVCVAQPTVAGGAAGQCKDASAGLTAGQKKVSAALTSLWENSSSTIQYGYCEDIRDKRGFTAGRAGFCTGTGDAIVVVKCYVQAKPGNGLEKFLAPLTVLENKFLAAGGDFEKAASGNTSTLGGYCAAWGAAGSDPVFRACQDAAVDSIYYGAALQHAGERNLTSALTKISLWDAQIMHGEADAVFGLRKQLAMTDAMVKLSPMPTREEESKWLGAFHSIRAHIMDNYDEWKNNNYRVALYEKLRLAGNLDVTGCVDTNGAKASTYWPGLSSASAPSSNVCP
jgi:hypothetical protein